MKLKINIFLLLKYSNGLPLVLFMIIVFISEQHYLSYQNYL